MTARETEFVLQAPWGPGFVIVAVVVAMAVLVFSAMAYRHLPIRAGVLAFLLRALATSCALAVLLQPAIRTQRVRRAPGRVAVIVDGSLSMTIKDGNGGTSRWERARAALGLDGRRAPWRAEHPTDWFLFHETLLPVSEGPWPEPSGSTTRILEAVEEAAGRVGEDLGGIVVVSDGADHGRLAARDGEDVSLWKRLGVPVHAVWTGNAGLRDISISALRHNELAFVRTPLKVDVDVRAIGYAGEAAVELEHGGRTVATRSVVLTPQGQTVSFDVLPKHVGDAHYTVVVRPRPDEALVENNRRSFVIRAVRDRIRVLHVCGRPSWDQRFLRQLLKREPNIDLISFYILRTPSDLQFIDPAELSLIPFPTDELFEKELSGFDLLIMQNFAHAPYGLTRHLLRVRDWVDQGGGLAIIGGDLAFDRGGWAGTPVADVLPLTIPREGGRIAGEFKASPRPGAEGHPIVDLAGSAEATRRTWDALPPLDGANRLGEPVGDATVLAEHPTEHLGSERAPVLAVREARDGRSLVLATDSSWRWSFLDVGAGGDGRAYERFWRTAIRWLIRDPALERVRVDLPRNAFAPGEGVPVKVRVFDRAFVPAPNTTVAVEVTRMDELRAPAGEDLARVSSLVSDDRGEAQLDLESLAPGAFRVRATATLDGRRSEDTRTFVVAPSGEELGEPEARDTLLRAFASGTGGSFLNVGDDLSALEFRQSGRVQLETRRDLELWAGFPMLFLALSALAGEWLLRRRWGLG